MSKFEQLLDFIVNEDHEAANALFHEIVVEKSRTIYENIIAEEEDEEEDECYGEASEDEDESMDEAADDEEDETIESMFGEAEEDDEEDDEEDEGEDDFPVQDQTDDFEDDTEDDAFGDLGDEDDDMDGDMDDDMDEPADKGDIQNLEDQLEELKAQFEKLMSEVDKDGDGDHDMTDHDMADDGMGSDHMGMGGYEGNEEGMMEASDDEDEDEEDESMKESRMPKSQGERMREYIEKVTANMDGGLVGARTGQTISGPKDGKSPVSSGSGKPTSGATAKNIAQSGKGADEDGTSPKGKVGGLLKSGGSFVPAGTKNVSNTASAKKPDGAKLDSVKKPGNKEGEGWGVGKGDKAGQTGSVDTKSPLSGAPNRAR